MPLPLTPEARDALEAGTVYHAWFLEMFPVQGALRGWTGRKAATYDGETFEGLRDRFSVTGTVNMGANLVPEPLNISFEGASQNEDASFIGRFLDRTWHQRRIRLRGVLLLPDMITPIGTHLDWFGRMDTLQTDDTDGGSSSVMLTCEGGTFRALARNMRTCTDADQRRRSSTDRFFEQTATKPQQDIPFGLTWSKVPGNGGRNR